MTTRYHELGLVIILFTISFSNIPQTSAEFFFPNASSIPHGILPNITNASNPWDSFHKLAGCRAGQNLDGLSKLKQYFSNFGYIQNGSSSSNFTDDFDDTLEAAVKNYQRNFNLNVTGELDQNTLDKIVLPRCGNADIVNGSTRMNSGKKYQTTSLFYTVSHYAFFEGEPKWSKQKLTYAFLDSSLTSEEKNVFARAFEKWSEVIPLNFTYTEDIASSDIRIGFFSGDHGDGEPFDGVLGTLAHSFSPESGRFHLDSAETWVVVSNDSEWDSASLTSSSVDLESVAVHEIGHLLGLAHSSVEESIMYPTIAARTRKVELANDDVEGIQYLYGSNPSYNASATSSQQERETNGAPFGQPLDWLLVILPVAVGFFSCLF